MGVVYKARHLALNRIVALKMILAGAHAGERALTLFRREAESVVRLQHPNAARAGSASRAPTRADSWR
jgi:serine/threonine protein kinase